MQPIQSQTAAKVRIKVCEWDIQVGGDVQRASPAGTFYFAFRAWQRTGTVCATALQ